MRNKFEKLVIWSDAPYSMIPEAVRNTQDKAFTLLPVCIKEALGVPDDPKLDFNYFST